MRQEIDQDRAIAMASSPGPLVHPDSLGSWRGGDRGCPHQTQEGGRTGGQPQARGEPGPRLPAERDADGPQDCGQPMGFAGIRSGEVRQALGKDAARTSQMAAHELPYEQLYTDGERTPREVSQPALVVAMHRGGRRGTVWAQGGRRDGRELDLHRLILHDHFRETNPTGRWE
jgi:hypothetical protein